MKRTVTGLICMLLLLSLTSCGETQPNYTVTYDVTGTESTQLFKLTYNDFLSAINTEISNNDMKLTIKKSSSSNIMFSENGETWKILVDIFTETEADSFAFRKYSDSQNWIGYIEEAELSLYSDSTEDATKNGIYIRALISIFTPGAEKEVEDALGIYGEPQKDAIVTDDVRIVTAGTVQYVYQVDDQFIVRPYVANWPAEETAPSAIRPQ